MAFKMRGNPMQRNFGIGSAYKSNGGGSHEKDRQLAEGKETKDQSPVWSDKATRLVEKRERRQEQGKSTERVQKRINKHLAKLQKKADKKEKRAYRKADKRYHKDIKKGRFNQPEPKIELEVEPKVVRKEREVRKERDDDYTTKTRRGV
tara:strand:- start:54 stop:500 length:447 start_codon:yes stop_codon:yes gene_type:complete